MANTTSGTNVFEQGFSIDEIIEESFERMGIQNVTGYQLKASRRTLNIMFQEWANRGLHYWEVENSSITLANGQNEYTLFRSSQEGSSNGVTTTLTGAIANNVTTIPVAAVANMPSSGKIKINNEVISYTGISSLNLTGATRATGIVVTLFAIAPVKVVVTPFELPSCDDLNKVYSFCPFAKVIELFSTSQ
jgi:hypothetical protein